jgi:chorismate-pyruvate lyase
MPRSSSISRSIAPGPLLEPGSIAYPLNNFYGRNGQLLPPLEEIDSGKIPEPYRSLLVHQNDMTSTLETFHGAPIHLRVVSSLHHAGEYFREVALLLEGSEKPVEFGAIKINIDLFPQPASKKILEEKWPLGRILKECKIRFASQPRGFLRIASDQLINSVLDLSGAHLLYGRRNTLTDPAGRSLAEIVEILPP